MDAASDELDAVAPRLRQRPRDDADVPPAERARAHAAWSGEARRLLEMLPVGDAQLPEHGCAQGEYCHLHLALALLPHTATRPIALRYLTLCPTYGPGTLDATLLGLPAAQDGDTAHFSILPAMSLAEQLGLARAARAATERAGNLHFTAT